MNTGHALGVYVEWSESSEWGGGCARCPEVTADPKRLAKRQNDISSSGLFHEILLSIQLQLCGGLRRDGIGAGLREPV